MRVLVKYFIIFSLLFGTSGCITKKVYIPTAMEITPPSVLMRPPQTLSPINPENIKPQVSEIPKNK